MNSQNNELKDYLVQHGFRRADVESMTEKELIETFSVIADSDQIQQKNKPQLPKSTSTNARKKCTTSQQKSKIIDPKSENGGLTEEEALRAAIQASKDNQSDGQDIDFDYYQDPNIDPQSKTNNSSQGIAGVLGTAFKMASDVFRNQQDHFTYLNEVFNPLQKNQGKNNSNYRPPYQQNKPENQNSFEYEDFIFSSDDNDEPPQTKQKQKPNSNNYYYYPPPNRSDNNFQLNNPRNNNNNYFPQNQEDDIPINQKSDYFHENDQPNNHQKNDDLFSYSQNDENQNEYESESSSSDVHPEIFNETSKIIQQQNNDLKKLEEEVAQKEREEEEKKLMEDEERNFEEACQVSLADEIIDYLDALQQEPPEPKTQAEKRNIATLLVTIDSKRRVTRRFSVKDRGIYVYAWVAGHTLDSDDKLTLDNFELKIPFGERKVLDKNLTLEEQGIHGKVSLMVSEL
ncbi:hypothetical protein M9Y10_005311 [Tritrichomonas musculus]|uniref:UBX domain-containing protein n=1 Tax=Tritrichomonas musculus TaxID=1915356 RepID=A0ABR2JLZ2_9EUKA